MIRTKKDYVIKEEVKATAKKRKATRKIKNQLGKYYNSGFVKSVMLHLSTHERLSRLGNLTSTYEKIIIKLLLLAENDNKIKKEIMGFDYRKLKVE